MLTISFVILGYGMLTIVSMKYSSFLIIKKKNQHMFIKWVNGGKDQRR